MVLSFLLFFHKRQRNFLISAAKNLRGGSRLDSDWESRLDPSNDDDNVQYYQEQHDHDFITNVFLSIVKMNQDFKETSSFQEHHQI